ncbi:MAG: cytochrome C oxidase subunit I [Burkholderiales bacterium]|jgi:cytochrome oxidase Cu insertion factor (SCO1/SenC/PrrC family)|nr:cytochrome C oxidase subunit I [Burkholderiales bacterium]MDP2397939.1 cytochrome C oxidase subunit I [Burkholderiales bacterium]
MSNEPRPQSRKTLWLIAAVCIAPFVLSFAAYYFYQPEGRVNYGEIVEGHQMPETALKLADGRAFSFAQLRGRWIFVTVDAAACDAYCDKKLWQIRQVRKTQGKYPERIERVWLISDGGIPGERERGEYEGTWFVNSAGSDVLNMLPHAGTANDHIYLVDPLGNVVLRYPRDADPTRIKKDLQRLLRVSRIG